MSGALSVQMTGDGYEYVRSRANGEDATVYIHRLLYVAEHGFDSLPPGWHVHHVRSVPWLNTPDNLEAVDPDSHRRHHLHGEPVTVGSV